MKRCTLVSLLFFLALLLGCQKENRPPEEKIQVVASSYIEYDLARQILGESSHITLLQKPGMESHSYEPTPQDLIRITKCDLFLYGGGESDQYIEKILASCDQKPRAIFALLNEVDALEEESVEGMQKTGHAHDTHQHDAYDEQHKHDAHQHDACDEQHKHDAHQHDAASEEQDMHKASQEDAHKEHHAHHEHGEEIEHDEHVWTSPKNTRILTEKLCLLLCELDPANKVRYQQNAQNYCAQLEKIDNAYRELAKNANRNVLIFGDRFPFLYLCKEYGWSYYAAFPGCAEQTEPSAATLKFLIEKIKEENVPCICQCAYTSNRIAQVLCEETGAQLITLHPGHTVRAEEMETLTYTKILWDNLESLKQALCS